MFSLYSILCFCGVLFDISVVFCSAFSWYPIISVVLFSQSLFSIIYITRRPPWCAVLTGSVGGHIGCKSTLFFGNKWCYKNFFSKNSQITL